MRFLSVLVALWLWPIILGNAVAKDQSPPILEAAFSPKGRALDLVVRTIRNAQRSIYVASYSFTSKPIAGALRDAQRRGVKVMVVADAKANKKYSAVQFLANAGIPARTNDDFAILHNKYMVIDESTVQTGSFNYTAAAATRNAENVIVIRDARVAQQYLTDWAALWASGKPVPTKY